MPTHRLSPLNKEYCAANSSEYSHDQCSPVINLAQQWNEIRQQIYGVYDVKHSQSSNSIEKASKHLQ